MSNPTWHEKDLGSVMVDITGKKNKQTPVEDPTSSGTDLNFISGISQDANGAITPVKKRVADMQGATSGAGGVAGLVPAPGSADAEKFLRGDGTWAEGGGSGNAVVLLCDMGTITELPTTKYFDEVTDDMTVIYYEMDNPQAFASALEVETDDGSITVDGTIVSGKESSLKLTLSTTAAATETT